MSKQILVRNAAILGTQRADILIEDGIITQIEAGIVSDDAFVIEAEGLVALPGLVDMHVHFREPGYEASETIFTGSRAAAAGGFTTVFTMPNTYPVADSAGVVDQELALGEAAGYCRVQPIGAVTVGQKGEKLAELGAMAASRARVRVFSDDGFCVWDPQIMRRALEYVKSFNGVIAQHSQDPRLTEGAQMNEGVVSAELGLTPWPSVAEESIIARDVLLAEHVGSRLHVCHLSTAGSVDIIRWAKERGVQVTAEATPHHLLLDEELVRGYDPRFKVNPPLRTKADVEAVRAGLADGTIDIVATDHAPHPADSKNCEWASAANGMVGLESSLAIIHKTMVEPGTFTWEDVARVMSENPASIGGLASVAGRPIKVGEPASITLYDPNDAHIFAKDDLRGRSDNSPYLGIELPGRIKWTIFDGVITVADGELLELEGANR